MMCVCVCWGQGVEFQFVFHLAFFPFLKRFFLFSIKKQKNYGNTLMVTSQRTVYSIISAAGVTSSVPFVVSMCLKCPMAVSRPMINTAWNWAGFVSSLLPSIHLLPHFEDHFQQPQ